MPEKVVHLGARLHYPIVVTKFRKQVGEDVNKQDVVFDYKFTWRRQISDEEWTDETTYTEYESPAEGKLKQWRIKEGDVVHANMPGMVIDEACAHETQMHGMCADCGANMTEVNWASDAVDVERAMINMTHDNTGLKVSHNVATRAEHETQKTLLRNRKLSLVVDLDQTIIHACVDPTIEKWKKDTSSPNHAVVKDVRSFWLNDASGGQTYYIKLRPGLEEFLQEAASMYELHVYTMGTREYARHIQEFIDPERKLFGDRVISRNENGNHSTKQLQRLFPVSTDMVVIIDDRSDVWPLNERNLIKVVPFDFFKGQGDLNSPFAPQPTNTPNALTPSVPPTTESNGGAAPSPIETLAKMGGGGDEATLENQKEEHDKAVEKQLTQRPLLHMQEELESKEGSATTDTTSNSNKNGNNAGPRPQLLVDDDEELIALQDHLTDIHAAFYDMYDKRRAELKKSDKPQHLPGHKDIRRKSADDGVDLSLVPDVGDIMTDLKSNVLEGLVLVLSGIVPLGVTVEQSEIGRQAQSFGAQVLDSIDSRVTHLVVANSRPRTKKVQQAAKIPTINIVSQNWLTDCLSQWRRLDESPYFMTIHDADRAAINAGVNTEPASEDDGEGLGQSKDEDLTKDLEFDDDDEFEKELQEILGSDTSDDESDPGINDDESDTSEEGEGKRSGGTKRKERAEGGESDNESVLAKKQRIARSRGASALRSVRTPNGAAADMDDETGTEDGANSQPTPSKHAVAEDDGEDFDEDELERALLAEFEASD